MKFYAQVRTYKGSPTVADVWIIKQDGAVHSGMMHGFGFRENIEALAHRLEDLGFPTRYEESPFTLAREDYLLLLPPGSTSRDKK